MAANNKIRITFGDEFEVALDKDAPNIKEFVKTLTTNRELITVDSIKVEGPSPEFDAKSFKEVLTEVISEYLDAISIEDGLYAQVVNKPEPESLQKEKVSRGTGA